MCTLSFVPGPIRGGFVVAMNRDEKRTRSRALPPATVDFVSTRAVFPRESTGGTWIAANDAGTCLALINWHRIEREPPDEIVSRGQVVPALIGKSSAATISAGIREMPLRKVRPFRLIAVIAPDQVLIEWRWDLRVLTRRKHPWRLQHWFSSGFDEPGAAWSRRRVCREARKRASATGVEWLRRLHRSHSPVRGPFSICMHRNEAKTVSYTEVTFVPRRVTMRYRSGSPCSASSTITKSL